MYYYYCKTKYINSSQNQEGFIMFESTVPLSDKEVIRQFNDQIKYYNSTQTFWKLRPVKYYKSTTTEMYKWTPIDYHYINRKRTRAIKRAATNTFMSSILNDAYNSIENIQDELTENNIRKAVDGVLQNIPHEHWFKYQNYLSPKQIDYVEIEVDFVPEYQYYNLKLKMFFVEGSNEQN